MSIITAFKMNSFPVFPVLSILLPFLTLVYSHGYMYDPVNRASRWRLDPTNLTIPHNYEDNQFFCGGFAVQHYINEGRCGPCGDDYRDEVPRSNENGGIYSSGVIAARYLAGAVVKTDIRITANHLGKISYQLCNLQDPNMPESEDCFQALQLEDGSYYQNIGSEDYNVTSYVKLPDDVICERCVLRWHYSAGNNWGPCENGTSAVGCGPQETFRSCADIQIEPFHSFRPYRI